MTRVNASESDQSDLNCIAKQLSAQTSLAHARSLRSARGSGSWVPRPSLSAAASAMAQQRSASADQSPGSIQPGPFLQSHAVRSRQARAEAGVEGPHESAPTLEPQEQVRARIDTIEEQIQQLMEKKLELQKVAKVVTAADGSGTPPGMEPSVTGSPEGYREGRWLDGSRPSRDANAWSRKQGRRHSHGRG